MNTYFCKLVENGIVKESFYRQGTDETEVLEGLELFQFGTGDWVIEPA